MSPTSARLSLSLLIFLLELEIYSFRGLGGVHDHYGEDPGTNGIGAAETSHLNVVTRWQMHTVHEALFPSCTAATSISGPIGEKNRKINHLEWGNSDPERQTRYSHISEYWLEVRITMLQSTDPERLSNKEGSRGGIHESSWEGKIETEDNGNTQESTMLILRLLPIRIWRLN